LVSKKYPALQVRSYSRRITNFALVRNYGLKQARHDWVLFLDSDEVLDPGGVKKLRKIASTRAAGATLVRSDVFYGKKLRFGEGGRMALTRFVFAQKTTALGEVHEVLKVTGNVVASHCTITHYAHASISDFLSDVSYYAQIAGENKKTNTIQSLLELATFPVGKFLFSLILQGSILDGWRGVTYSVMMSLHSLFVRIYHYEHSTHN
jgi:glycosyltransferase involved in cell wall biosynthesis